MTSHRYYKLLVKNQSIAYALSEMDNTNLDIDRWGCVCTEIISRMHFTYPVDILTIPIIHYMV